MCDPTLGGDKVSMVTHTYPHKPLRKTGYHMESLGWHPTLCVAWCLIWWLLSLKSMVIHNAKCPYWDQVSFKPRKPKPMCDPICNWCSLSSFRYCTPSVMAPPPHLEYEVAEALEKFNRDPDSEIRRMAHRVLAAYRRTGKWNILWSHRCSL